MIRFLLIFLVACSGGPVHECDDNLPCTNPRDICSADFQCVEFKCATSAQCPMEAHCDDGQCIKGCVEDGDCKTGYQCNIETDTCEKVGCTDSNIDCGFKEFCNIGTGECYTAGGEYCKFCDEDTECGSGICYAHYCAVDCSGGRECPHGFDCAEFTDTSGNPVAFGCITYCELFDDYDPGSFLTSKIPRKLPPGADACVASTPQRMAP
jgi:hypothetical protein